MASTILLKFPRNVETVTTNSKIYDVKQGLSRIQRPLDSTKISLELYGIHALPEAWKAAIAAQDPTEALYQYEIEIAGVKMTGGKGLARELSKEEKAEAAAAAAAKGAKGAPPKGKGAPAEAEPTPEEIAAQEKAAAEKEAADAKAQAEWDLLDEDTKFYRTNEDPQKEPRVVIENKIAV
jgi:hypothetical protein